MSFFGVNGKTWLCMNKPFNGMMFGVDRGERW